MNNSLKNALNDNEVSFLGSAPFCNPAKNNPHTQELMASKVRITVRHALENRDRKGADPSEWPKHLRVREFPRSEAA